MQNSSPQTCSLCWFVKSCCHSFSCNLIDLFLIQALKLGWLMCFSKAVSLAEKKLQFRDHKWFQNGCNKYVYPIHFVLYCYINSSLYSDWKYARILVCRHYLFWDVNSSERMKLEENCELWGTMMSKDKYTSIFSCQMEAIIFITLQIFLQCVDKIFANNLLFAVWDV